MSAYELARQYPDTVVLAFDPGLMPGTGLARNHHPLAQVAWASIAHVLAALPFASTPGASARHLVRIAVGLDTYPSGSHVERGKAVPSSTDSYDASAQAKLIADSRALIAERRAASRT